MSFHERLANARSRYAFLLWDLDGTLVDLNVDWPAVRRELSGMLVLEEERPLTELLAIARSRGRGEEAFALVASREVQALGSVAVPITDTLAVLRAEAGRSAIVTNNMSRLVRAFLRTQFLPGVPFVAQDMVQRPKPDTEGIERLRSRWGDGRAILIGDADHDAELARRAGLDFLRVGRG
jgi:HAD superfamily hydrolase (TIGR01549 family)